MKRWAGCGVGGRVVSLDDYVSGGQIDIGVMYTPQSRPGLTVEHLLEELLVMVSN